MIVIIIISKNFHKSITVKRISRNSGPISSGETPTVRRMEAQNVVRFKSSYLKQTGHVTPYVTLENQHM